MSERRKVLELFDQQQAYTEDRINYGIEQYRKGYGEIIVEDENGNSLIPDSVSEYEPD